MLEHIPTIDQVGNNSVLFTGISRLLTGTLNTVLANPGLSKAHVVKELSIPTETGHVDEDSVALPLFLDELNST